jgi:hypothetical protein
MRPVLRGCIAIFCLAALAGCDDDDGSSVQLLGGGPGGSSNPVDVASANSASAVSGAAITTMASEFGYVDNPAVGGNGDPGTTGNWYTGAGGAYIGGQDSTGISLPASTEVALYGSTSAAMGQSVQVIDTDTGQQVTTQIVDIGPGTRRQAAGYGLDVTYGTARQLGIPVNGSANVQVIPLTSKDFH